jgi:hypothetical protein
MRQYKSAFRLITLLSLALTISLPAAKAQSPPPAEPPPEVTATQAPTKILNLNPSLSYVRPTPREKLRLFAFDAFGPYAIGEALISGGSQQATNSPPEWGGGMNAFGERAASTFGIELVTTTTRYGMAAVLHEDAAYYRCECSGFFPRVRHALISTLTARHGEDGHTTFSISGLVSPYAGSMTALAWYPARFGVKDGFRMGNYNLGGLAIGNLALEFIYGGPHTMFSRIRASKSEGGTGPSQNP